MTHLISIIIPIYNVEKYLVECLDSVLNQTYTRFEVIMINDGSPDKSPQIAQSYVDKDSRFKLINQENMGIAETRNVGIKNATGDYILFIDSDDYITLDALQLFIDKLNECGDVDIIQGFVTSFDDNNINTPNIFENSNDFSEKMSEIRSGKDFLFYKIINDSLNTVMWLFLFKKNYIDSLSHLFFKFLYVYEDIEFIPRALYQAKSATQLNKIFYHYRLRNGSLSHTKNENFYNGFTLAILHILRFFKDKPRQEKDVLWKFVSKNLYYLLCNRHSINETPLRECYKLSLSYTTKINEYFYFFIIVYFGFSTYERILSFRLLFSKKLKKN